jgi:mercuric ion transport protein
MLTRVSYWIGQRIRRDSGAGSCAITITPEQAQRRGTVWVIGAFVLCPCHLPLTLTLLATLLGGTAFGLAIGQHPFIAGAIITAAWAIGTWRGVRLLRDANQFARGRVRQHTQ